MRSPEETVHPAREWAVGGDDALFVLLLLAHLAPIWAFRFVPTQDGPSHLSNAVGLLEYLRSPESIFRKYYSLNPSIDANWLSYLALVPLVALMPSLVAEKVFLSAYLVSFPLSARYALGAITPRAASLAVLTFPFLHNLTFHMGFYNFCLSLPLFLLVTGYWIRHGERFSVRVIVALCAASTVLYFAHPFSFVAALVTAAGIWAWETFALAVRTKHRSEKGVRAIAQRAVVIAAGFLPGVALAIRFSLQQGNQRKVWLKSNYLWEMLANCSVLVSYRAEERWFSVALAAGFAILILLTLARKLRLRTLEPLDGFLVPVLVLVVAYFELPNWSMGGSFINVRLMIFPYLLLILWFGAQGWGPRLTRVAQVGALAISLGLLALHARTYFELNAYLEEYTSGADRVEAGSTILTLTYSEPGLNPDGRPLSIVVRPFAHAAGYVAAERRAILLRNYEADTKLFPLIFRAEVDPYRWMPGLGETIPGFVFENYSKRTPGRVDYVLEWQAAFSSPYPRHRQLALRQLARGYDLVFESKPNGFMRVFQKRPTVSEELSRNGCTKSAYLFALHSTHQRGFLPASEEQGCGRSARSGT